MINNFTIISIKDIQILTFWKQPQILWCVWVVMVPFSSNFWQLKKACLILELSFDTAFTLVYYNPVPSWKIIDKLNNNIIFYILLLAIFIIYLFIYIWETSMFHHSAILHDSFNIFGNVSKFCMFLLGCTTCCCLTNLSTDIDTQTTITTSDQTLHNCCHNHFILLAPCVRIPFLFQLRVEPNWVPRGNSTILTKFL